MHQLLKHQGRLIRVICAYQDHILEFVFSTRLTLFLILLFLSFISFYAFVLVSMFSSSVTFTMTRRPGSHEAAKYLACQNSSSITLSSNPQRFYHFFKTVGPIAQQGSRNNHTTVTILFCLKKIGFCIINSLQLFGTSNCKSILFSVRT